MLLKRYGNIDYIMGLSLKRAAKLISKASEEEKKEYFYRWWLVRYSSFAPEKYENFEEFYEKVNPDNIKYDTRSKEEIIAELHALKRKEE